MEIGKEKKRKIKRSARVYILRRQNENEKGAAMNPEIEIMHGGERLTFPVSWEGAGLYYFESADGMGSISLEQCQDLAEVQKGVEECIAQGTGEEDWAGWRIAPGEL